MAIKKKQNTLRKWIGKLHLWGGLFIGFLVFIISITGALYVFKDEVESLTRKKYIYHGEKDIQNKNTLPIKILEKKLYEQNPEKHPALWVNIPLDKNLSYQFFYYEKNPEAWHYFDEFVIYKVAYVNPFTGKVLKVYDEKNGFFNIVKFIHWSYLLNSSWGKYLTGIPVLIFIFMLISGIILWWPKNKKVAKQRVWFQWKNIKNWKRKNYDLHSILGFYSAFFALIISITGIFYAFTTVQTIIYYTFSGGETKSPDFSIYKTTAPTELQNEHTLDKIAKTVEYNYPNAYSYSLSLTNGDKQAPLSVFVKELSYSYHKNHLMIFDKNSGKLLKIHDHKEKNTGEKAIAANYDIHVGSIFGIWSKVLAFVVSLICASLPVTGFLVWWGRKKKNRV